MAAKRNKGNNRKRSKTTDSGSVYDRLSKSVGKGVSYPEGAIKRNPWTAVALAAVAGGTAAYVFRKEIGNGVQTVRDTTGL